MAKYSRILLATDFSDASRKALTEAVRIARRNDAELHVLHVDVIAQQNIEGFDYPPLADYIRRLDQVSMDAVGRDIGPGYKKTFPAILRDTSEPAGILRYAREKQVDLIVLGTHGRNALAEAFMGSVAQRVTREATGPLLIVGPHDTAAPHGGRPVVLAPVGFTAACVLSLREAAGIAVERDAQQIAVHAIDPSRSEENATQTRAQIEEGARERLEDFVRDARLPLEAETVVGIGHADEVIFDVAAKRGVALIVIAASKHSTLERVLFGSVSKRVVRGAPCPVLVYRQPEAPVQERAAA